jgi:hypothetical protein
MCKSNSKIELPPKIDDYILRVGDVGKFTVMEYSKTQLFMRHITHAERLHKLVPDNLLYEVISTTEEDAYDQMHARVNLNKQIVETDFKGFSFKLDTTYMFKEPTKGYDFLRMTFDSYVIIDTDSNAKFLVVVSTNINQDIPILRKLLDQLILNISENVAIKKLPHKTQALINETVFTNLVHLYLKNNVTEPDSIHDKFKREKGWKVLIKDPKYFKTHNSKLHKKLVEKRIIYCENKNAELFNLMNIPHTRFVGATNSFTLFEQIQLQETDGIRDRDYLTDGEISRLHKKFNNYFILDYYCIENYLYHPDNVESLLGSKKFDKQEYIEEIVRQKNESYDEILTKLIPSRNGYKELSFPDITISKDPIKEIRSSLKSNNFEQFYKYYDMKKKFNKSILESLNITPKQLCKTDWFKNKIADIINERD